MPSRKPYLLRAMHQWIMDSDQTPHIVVDVTFPGVEAPPGYAKDGKLVLNISYAATQNLELGNDGVDFSARFSGVSRHVHVPMHAIVAIYVHETGEGMLFEAEEESVSAGSSPLSNSNSESAKSTGGKKPDLKVVK